MSDLDDGRDELGDYRGSTDLTFATKVDERGCLRGLCDVRNDYAYSAWYRHGKYLKRCLVDQHMATG